MAGKFLTPVLGEDYLIDYYAILSIPRNAGVDEIKSAYREQMKQYHPDVVSRAAPEIQQEAEQRSKMIVLAYNTLRNNESKVSYDRQLADFNPELVSKNGTPILDLNAKRVQADYLVSGTGLEGKSDLMQRAKDLSGHNETVFNVVLDQYNANRQSKDLKEAYRSLLEKKNTYLSLIESFEWEDAGIANQADTRCLFYPEDHVAKRSEQMVSAEHEIAGTMEKRVLALSSGIAPKLLASGKAYDSEDAQRDATLKDELTGIAMTKFKSHTERLEELAKERAEVLEELVQLTEWEYYPAEQPIADKLLILLKRDKLVAGDVMYRWNGKSVEGSHYEKHGFGNVSLEELASDAYRGRIEDVISSGISMVLLSLNNELDLVMQTVHVATEHFDKYNKSK